MTGRVVETAAGIYKIKSENDFYSCTARGSLRKDDIYPAVGDYVEFTEESTESYVIVSVGSRKNHLIRPSVSNIDNMVIVVSVKDPPPNIYNIDKLTVICEYLGIKPILVFTKNDLTDGAFLDCLYVRTGYKRFFLQPESKDGFKELLGELKNATSVFAGLSGVGKSSLLNRIYPKWQFETGEISRKLGRGKHTTRRSTLIECDFGTVIDTPGFSAIDLKEYMDIRKEDLAECFPEFRELSEKCAFKDCSHINTKGCTFAEALCNGMISESRYKSYIAMYNEIKNIKNY